MRECGSETLTEITYLVLAAFCQPNHGYGALKFISENTNNRVIPGAGTLYGAINSLVKKEWISLYEQNDRKKIYLITDEGREILNKEVNRLKECYVLGKEVLKSGGEDL
ncbi:PadR family transcriptional regulator [Mediterraneibacter agrestimuris]|uniref:PadR family transcriptional regulator n=1 Tax=Mediterraneibacter agrestimuris TaxID=2941333 RepID=UPI002040D46B|nr:helix-turn-helix transcriptional regulator [Mediterraneibacter agrestimuris]